MAAVTGGDGTGVGEEQELADLAALLDRMTGRIADLDDEVRAGSSPVAEENRAIGGARAYLARRQAADMRADLDEVRRQAREMVRWTREARELRRLRREAGPDAPPDPAADDAAASGVRAAAAELVDVHDHDQVVERVVGCALRAVPAARWSVLSVLDAAGSSTLRRASDPALVALEDRQRRLAVGPVPDALVTHAVVAVDDLATDPRWPRLAALAADLGVRAVVAVPLPGRRVRATLTLYADAPRAFDAVAVRAAGAFADHAAIALSGARRVTGLNRALESRDVIGQAKGILAQRDGLGPDAAFAKLVAASQHANLRVADVARWMVGEGAAASTPGEP